MVDRAGWKAESNKCTKSIVPLGTSLNNVLIHHTAGPSCATSTDCEKQMKIIQKYHMEDGLLNDIRYNFLIGDDKQIYEGRGWSSAEYHNKTYLTDSVSIAYIGTFSDLVTDQEVLNVIKDFIDCGVEKPVIAASYTVKAYLHEGETLSPASDTLIGGIVDFLKSA
ncbi:peptidoglycan recognition protein 1-like [Hyperolius riggenbachi]|uniref:peptidoglycan recognition protein 1-like n=1 Tax=Hyperolius riggenbachi TaxID=752182 RepID=UPI0035A3216C